MTLTWRHAPVYTHSHSWLMYLLKFYVTRRLEKWRVKKKLSFWNIDLPQGFLVLQPHCGQLDWGGQLECVFLNLGQSSKYNPYRVFLIVIKHEEVCFTRLPLKMLKSFCGCIKVLLQINFIACIILFLDRYRLAFNWLQLLKYR